MEDYIKDIVFKDKQEQYDKLTELNRNIKNTKIANKPYLIEFLGSCRSGKSTTIELIVDVLRKNGLNVLAIEEEKIELTKSINKDRKKKINIDSLDYTNKIIEEKIMIYDSYYKEDADIIIFDRGINDEFIWLNTFGADRKAVEEYHKKLQSRYVDTLIILTCDIEVSLKRKYLNSLSIMPNKWTNPETMNNYLNSINEVSKYFKEHARKIYQLDTSYEEKVEVGVNVCNKIINNINS